MKELHDYLYEPVLALDASTHGHLVLCRDLGDAARLALRVWCCMALYPPRVAYKAHETRGVFLCCNYKENVIQNWCWIGEVASVIIRAKVGMYLSSGCCMLIWGTY